MITQRNPQTVLVGGAGGFIGSHLVKRLKKDGFWVRGVDLKYPEYGATAADEFIVGDLRGILMWRKKPWRGIVGGLSIGGGYGRRGLHFHRRA